MSTAPGKIILFGEHSVVYGKPAIAVPFPGVSTIVDIVESDDFHVRCGLDLTEPEKRDLGFLIDVILSKLNIKEKKFALNISSTIPVASGMGSSASLCTAMIRAISGFFRIKLADKEFTTLALECEKIFHDNPSGIDTTVIYYEKPVCYVKPAGAEIIKVKPFTLMVADTGKRESTGMIVSDVRREYDLNKKQYESYFNEMGEIATEARKSLEKGDLSATGKLMLKNHRLLQNINVSSPLLDNLVETAVRNGAYGAKLSGAGRGGNAIAIIPADDRELISRALTAAGSKRIIVAEVGTWNSKK